MANRTVRETSARNGLIPVLYADNGDGTFSRAVYDVSGAAGSADITVYLQTIDGAVPVKYHDNGDGTYSETVYTP